jgi:uncharacterized protein (TIGR03437 family)
VLYGIAVCLESAVRGNATNDLPHSATVRIPAIALVLAAGILSGAWVLRAQPARTEYPVPTSASSPAGITAGPDGNLWFTESDSNRIATITTSGAITEFAVSTPNAQPWDITVGPDGNLWFTEISANQIGRITTSGVITEYPIPTPPTPGIPPRPNHITSGPDGNLWFTEPNAGKIGTITPTGLITEYRAGVTYPTGITAGPDGNLWFTGGADIGQISPSGGVTLFPPVIGIRVDYLGLNAIVKGSDGNLWATGGGIVWRINTGGMASSYFLPADFAPPVAALAVGADGNLWFTSASNQIGRLTAAGVFTEYSIPSPAPSMPPSPPGLADGIASGPDGNIWLTEQVGNKIARLVLSTLPSDNLLNINPSALTFSSLAPPHLAAPVQTLTVSTSSSTSYTVSANAFIGPAWFTISPSGSFTGSQTFTVALNPTFNLGSFGAYTGDITFVSGNVTQSVPLTLNITPPVGPQRISAVVSAASGVSSIISPGEIVSVYGTSLGPASPIGLTLDSSGKVAKLLGGVSVVINGYPAPLAYVSSTQINCTVPYEIAGSSTANVQVWYLNQTSPAFSLRVADTVPGIFTLNGSGTGLAAALNGSGGLNGPANPASVGGYITFYLTGEGATSPVSTTGGVTTLNLSSNGPLTPQPQAPFSVSIGGQSAPIAFYGEAPGFVAGLLQVNAQIPDGLAPGSQPLVVSLGNAQSRGGVTVSVK